MKTKIYIEEDLRFKDILGKSGIYKTVVGNAWLISKNINSVKLVKLNILTSDSDFTEWRKERVFIKIKKKGKGYIVADIVNYDMK